MQCTGAPLNRHRHAFRKAKPWSSVSAQSFICKPDIPFCLLYDLTAVTEGRSIFACLLSWVTMHPVLTHFMCRQYLTVAFLARRRSFLHEFSYVGVHIRTGIDVVETSDQRCRQVSDVAVHDTVISTVLFCVLRCIRVAVWPRRRGVDCFIARRLNCCTDDNLTTL